LKEKVLSIKGKDELGKADQGMGRWFELSKFVD